MIKTIKAKTILSPLRNGPDSVFGTKYSMNLYRGCQHQCIYCDSRSSCYHIENFADILIKENALELLEKELKSKKKKGTIGLGSMNDAYMPIEKEMKLTRGALKIISKYKFPIHIITKSDLVLRDIDIIKEISKTYAAISLTITTADDELSKEIEPSAPVSSKRFQAIKILNEEDIYSGIVLTPVLPFITDNEENIKKIILKGKEAGIKYIIAFMGMTQREGQKEYYYNELDKRFPGIKEKYIQRYGSRYECSVPESNRLYKVFNELCQKKHIMTKMKFFKEIEITEPSLFL